MHGMTRIVWASELATALVGERVELTQTPPNAADVLTALESVGWGVEEISAIAYARRSADLPWPVPAPRDVVSAGPAQWYALVGEARTLLALDGDVRPPSTRTALSADERRLLVDVPPHW